MKKDTLKSIIVLTAICLVISVAMAFTNGVTAPVIEEAEEKAAAEALYTVLPDATGFSVVELSDLPETVSAVYRDDGGSGYAVMLSAKGYDSSKPMSIAVGIGNDGRITSCHVVSASGETSGIGSKVTNADFLSGFSGGDSSLEGVDAISGATISSSAFISAVKDSFTAYNMAKEADAK
ncbi:MAG: FMN-binding protein [Eubacteriales bacterium]